MIIRHILCPIDFSDASAHAVDHATVLALGYGARITALHVDTAARVEVPDVPAVTSEAERQRLQGRVAAFCQAATTAGVPVDVRVVSGHAVAEILDHAASLPADLIVMGTHGVSGFQHLVLGSVTEKVLRRAGCRVSDSSRSHHAMCQRAQRSSCASATASRTNGSWLRVARRERI